MLNPQANAFIPFDGFAPIVEDWGAVFISFVWTFNDFLLLNNSVSNALRFPNEFSVRESRQRQTQGFIFHLPVVITFKEFNQWQFSLCNLRAS
jgi:hypothetical protein